MPKSIVPIVLSALLLTACAGTPFAPDPLDNPSTLDNAQTRTEMPSGLTNRVEQEQAQFARQGIQLR